jgi:hypothetical protein
MGSAAGFSGFSRNDGGASRGAADRVAVGVSAAVSSAVDVRSDLTLVAGMWDLVRFRGMSGTLVPEPERNSFHM